MADVLQSKVDVVLTSLCSKEGVEFNGHHYVPDMTKAYFLFEVAHAFPVSTVDNQGLHPSVISKSFETMRDQKISWEHQIALYHQNDKDIRDKVIGSIKDVSFTGGPNSQWAITADRAKSPGIKGVGVLFKETQGSANALGNHIVGSKRLTVSMEVTWDLYESGFAIALNGGKPTRAPNTPSDFIAAGYEYIDYNSAPVELQSCYSAKSRRICKTFEGRKVVILLGGLSNPVHFMGIGICRFGAEPEARITSLKATADEEALKNFLFFKEALSLRFPPTK